MSGLQELAHRLSTEPELRRQFLAHPQAVAAALGLPTDGETAAALDELVRSYESGGAASRQGLTPRQLEVLRLVAEGQTNREAARALGISQSTVEKHLAAVYELLDVASRAEAVAQAMRAGLLR